MDPYDINRDSARSKPPGIVLFDNSDRGRRSSVDSALTPLDSIASPAVFYNENIYPRKLHRNSKDAGSGSGGPSRFLHNPDEDAVMYPDDETRGRFAFLRQTNPQIVIAVFLGVGLGVLLSKLEVSADVSDLVNLPGNVFLRILKCFVIPMVFCSLCTGVANIVLLGKVSSIGTRTALLFILFSTVGTTISTIVAMTLRRLHPNANFEPIPRVEAFLHVSCYNNMYLQQTEDSGLKCAATNMSDTTAFQVIDLSNALSSNAQTASVDISQQFTGILQSLIPRNIFKAFEDGVLMSVIIFSLAFGASATKATSQQSSPLIDLLNQMNKIFFFVITKLIDWSPIAVLSLIAGSLAGQQSLSRAVNHVGVLVLSHFLSIALMEGVFYPCVLWLTTRKNPFKYMRQMLPCIYFAFGCASSLATLPITLRCVESTREVSRALLRFVVTIGCTVHMNGSAMLFPQALVFLASTAKTEIEIGWVQVVLIVLISVLSSIGVAPIPNGDLVLIYSIWATIFPNEEMPSTYSFIVATYWYLDRMNTWCNVVGDTYVARIIAEQVDETFENNAAAAQNDVVA